MPNDSYCVGNASKSESNTCKQNFWLESHNDSAFKFPQRDSYFVEGSPIPTWFLCLSLLSAAIIADKDLKSSLPFKKLSLIRTSVSLAS